MAQFLMVKRPHEGGAGKHRFSIPSSAILSCKTSASIRSRIATGSMRCVMKIDGRCHCGLITYEKEIDPEKVMICHGTDCQTLTGSAFRTFRPIARGWVQSVLRRTQDFRENQ